MIHRTGISLVQSLLVKSSGCACFSWTGNTQGPRVCQRPVRSTKQRSCTLFLQTVPQDSASYYWECFSSSAPSASTVEIHHG